MSTFKPINKTLAGLCAIITVFVLSMILVFPAPIFAEDTGSISGNITPVTSNAAIPVTVNLKSSVYGPVIATTTANSTTGAYTLSGILYGDYVLEFTRVGYITRYSYISVNNSQINVADKTLIAGDVDGNLVVDSADNDLLALAFNSVSTDSRYNPACDFNASGSVNIADYTIWATNNGSIVEDYNEGIAFNGSISGCIEPVTSNATMPVTINLKVSIYGKTIATTTANSISGEYSLSGLREASFVLEFRRIGYVTRYSYVTVNGSQTVVDDKSLIPGDVNGDLVVDSADYDILALAYNTVSTDSNYNPACDFDASGTVDLADYTILATSNGSTVESYNEDIAFDGSIGGYVEPITNNTAMPVTVNLRSTPYGQIIATTTVDSNGEFYLSGLWDGDFVLEFSRAGYITRYSYVSVDHTYIYVEKVLIPGDVNGDLAVDSADYDLLALAYDTVSTDSNYNPACDFDGDNTVGLADYTIWATNNGKTIADYNEGVAL